MYDPPKFLNTSEAAVFLGVHSRKTIQTLVRNRHLVPERQAHGGFGLQKKFRLETLIAFKEKYPDGPPRTRRKRKPCCEIKGCHKKVEARGLCSEHLKEYLSRRQAAAFLGIHVTHIGLLVKEKIIKERGRRSIRLSDIQLLKDQHPDGIPIPEKRARGRKALSPEKRAERLKELQELARSRGGECLSTEYVNMKTPVLWRCAEGHEWFALVNNVKNPPHSWCAVCFYKYRHRNAPKQLAPFQKVC